MPVPPDPDLILDGDRVVTPTGVRPARLRISGGVIRSVEEIPRGPARPGGSRGGPGPPGPSERSPSGGARIDVDDAVVMPGAVDVHVHVNEPGRTEWEGFRTATDAAAAGGVTTIVDMPLNCVPPTVDVAALEEKAERAAGLCRVDYGFWGGAVPGNADRLAPLAAAGALGVKAFLCPSGIEEFSPLGRDSLREALAAAGRVGLPFLAHAELPDLLRDPAAGGTTPDPHAHAAHLATRPPEAEVEAVATLLRASAGTGARVHVVHLSAGGALDPIRRAREERGTSLTVETCPHYLTFSAEEIPDGATTFKCAPPIRDAENRAALWRGLRAGEIDLVASDHSPCPPEMKERGGGDFLAAWGGIASLQIGLAATWTEARRRGHDLVELARWWCDEPARLAGLADRKGRIAPGRDADLVIWDPDDEWTVRGRELHHRHPLTPYEGLRLRGRIRRTLVRGRTVFEEGHLPKSRIGRWLRGRAA